MGAAGTLDTRPGESTAKEKKIAGLRQWKRVHGGDPNVYTLNNGVSYLCELVIISICIFISRLPISFTFISLLGLFINYVYLLITFITFIIYYAIIYVYYLFTIISYLFTSAVVIFVTGQWPSPAVWVELINYAQAKFKFMTKTLKVRRTVYLYKVWVKILKVIDFEFNYFSVRRLYSRTL